MEAKVAFELQSKFSDHTFAENHLFYSYLKVKAIIFE